MNKEYWNNRYKSGKTSGSGSYGKVAEWKADSINSFVSEMEIESVIEFGCGDGSQLSLSKYRKYIGYDISEEAVKLCTEKIRRENYNIFTIDKYNGEVCDLALSLEVIFHLVDNAEYFDYMHRMFSSSRKWVIIMSSNIDGKTKNSHVLHRMFTKDIPEGWEIVRILDPPDGSFSQMYFIKRVGK